MAKYDAYYKDMSESGLKKLEEYGFRREVDEYDGIVYEVHYEHSGLWLDVEYIPEKVKGDGYDIGKKVIGNGEFGLDDSYFRDFHTVADLEILCKLYKDGLIEFKEMPGTAYEMKYGAMRGDTSYYEQDDSTK